MSPNNVAIVLWIQVSDVVILLGADLEARGWVQIVQSAERPGNRATAFEVSHQGGKSAHEPSVWREMVESDVVAVLAPWCLAGRTLPTQNDMRRILSETGYAYITTNPERKRRVRRRRISASSEPYANQTSH